MGLPTESLFLYRHGAMDNTVSDRQGSRRDTFFRYVHKRLPNGARIGRLGFPEQALVYQCLDDPIRHLGAGQDEAAALALTAATLALFVGNGGAIRHSDRYPSTAGQRWQKAASAPRSTTASTEATGPRMPGPAYQAC